MEMVNRYPGASGFSKLWLRGRVVQTLSWLRCDRLPSLRSCVITVTVAGWLLGVCCTFGTPWHLARAGDLPILSDQAFLARDSLAIGSTETEDEQTCLDGLKWLPSDFRVDCQPSGQARFDVIVRFASPVDSGDPINDRVAMEWHVARDERGNPASAPAVIVVHESGSKMTVGRAIAFGLSRMKLNAFLLQLPGYGLRRDESQPSDEAKLLTYCRQAIADVRRARDAVAVLPLVDRSHIALQGTSLGGFVSATTAALDAKFDSVFIFLAGADLYDVVQNGQRDAAKLREKLAQAGISEARLKELFNAVEPKRVAHRLSPQKTWLFSGKYDNVVPPKNSKLLAECAHLAPDHHVEMSADHYSGAIFLPLMLLRVSDEIKKMKANTVQIADEVPLK